MTRLSCVGVVLVTASTVLAVAACGPSPTVASAPTSREQPPRLPATTQADAATLSIGTGATDSWSGYLPDGVTLNPDDTSSQALARLDPKLLAAIQNAARSAAAQGVDITITSGWRSKGFQQRLFEDAVRRYANVDTARQFVASPEESRHVVGEAVDIAGTGASDWLIRNGAQFGLCQIYANENWHFERATDDVGRCPPLRPNAAG